MFKTLLLEDTKLIAEFMGGTYHPRTDTTLEHFKIDIWDSGEMQTFLADDGANNGVKFHKNWGHLMAVVRRMNEEVFMSTDGQLRFREENSEIVKTLMSNDVKGCFDVVVKVLKKLKSIDKIVQSFRIGDRFKMVKYTQGLAHEEEYILAQTANKKVNLINLKTGNRWSGDGVEIGSVHRVKIDEFENGFGKLGEKWVKL